ncbi:MAG: hypothetical protein IJ532_03115 [Alphaproteobacteria bacterium]|nr:hypothetical protein [Alphaproteobacteria bacterium]
MLEYVSYQIGKPLKLIVFLHGYNGTVADHQYAVDWICRKLKDSVVIVPQAPQVSDKNPQKKQWFGMLKYDAANTRANPETSVEEIFSIYNQAANEIKHCADSVNKFIDEMQKKFSIANDKTYLLGFSQGAMLTIYTALSRQNPLAGAFSLSGLIAGADLLDKDIKSYPPLWLLHGENDLKVQYKTLPHSIEWLKNHRINPQVITYADLAHKICEAEIEEIAKVVNLKF